MLTTKTRSVWTEPLALWSCGTWALELQGATTLDVYVLLSAATITSPPATLTAGISSTNLACEAAGNISSIQWIKDGLPLSPSNNTTFSADNRRVYLSPVQDIDNGEYDCLVSNPVSNRTASHNLTVIQRMEALHIGNYTCTATNNITGLKDSVVYKLKG
uniref:Ig-like domain-containing protein n=1 Tax=Hucho hucho TaxID=62062 RepID=A0A4W5PNG2_9TELE